MKYNVLAKKIYNTRVNKNYLQIRYSINRPSINRREMWCIHSSQLPNYGTTIYDIENILIKYPNSIIKLNTYDTQTGEVQNDAFVITHLDE